MNTITLKKTKQENITIIKKDGKLISGKEILYTNTGLVKNWFIAMKIFFTNDKKIKETIEINVEKREEIK